MPSSPPPATSPPTSPLLPTVTPPSLADRLCSVLPKDQSFGIYHLSTSPQKTEALFSPPPDEQPDRTYCEKHFFVLSIFLPSKEQQQKPAPEDVNTTPTSESQQAPPKREVLVLGLEIFLYTTSYSTTLFVSKADSTGYLPPLGLPRHGSASPVRDVCAAFIEHLVEHRRRAGIQFVISLFARSQGQYLFPGSVDHGGKHILDDRALIKWWCRVLDPLTKSPPPPLSEKDAAPTQKQSGHGYLLVPGLDAYETRAFIPHRGPSSSSSSSSSSSWTVAHPLERISRYYREFDWVPPRCLIPRFPDDPKCRFRDELDEETGLGALRRTTGNWKNIKTLDMFWEMMAYRQECSSGRMTGFIWVVLEDEALETAAVAVTPANNDLPSPSNTSSLPTPAKVEPQTRLKSIAKAVAKARANPKLKIKRFKKLRGGVIRRQLTAKTQQRNHDIDIPTKTRHYYWPQAGRGSRILNERAYKRITELMLHSDFSTLDKAVSSTERWIKEGGLGNGDWGCLATGQREETSERDGASCSSAAEVVKVNDVGGLVKRKRTKVSPDGEDVKKSNEEGHVNVLGAALVRKKVKTSPDTVVGEGGA
ncbi:hypothetical protein E4U52_004067 [Claviceps spartinae]|nr:hypothetical protein E4U52_004067 [Claviceps spartinae]